MGYSPRKSCDVRKRVSGLNPSGSSPVKYIGKAPRMLKVKARNE